MTNKVITADAAARLIQDGDRLTTSGFVGIGVPDELLAALQRRFAAEGAPRGLKLLFAAGQGDGAERGLNRLSAEGLLGQVVGGHWGLIPKVGKLALAGRIEAYNLPQGCISQLYRDIAAGKPGMLSRVGLGTFVDPRLGGGKINAATTEDMVSLIEIGGTELLFYKALPIDIAFLRGSTADEIGNVTMEREALVLDNLAQAMAVRNSGGIVIVQVERIAAPRSLSPRDVVIPAALVDAVVVAAPENHLQTYATAHSPFFSGRLRASANAAQPMPLDVRKVIARRVAFELPVGGVVNLGIGMPEGVAAVAGEEGLLSHVTLTAEPGVIGGQPASGMDFGAAVNTDAIIPQNAQFDFYDGGGLDMACLGLAEVDGQGHVNVSRFGPKLAGAGGFINISQNAKSVVFAGTFTAGGLEVAIDGGLTVTTEGRARKFRADVEQITFSGSRAAALGKRVLYVTERAVFELTPRGLKLTEIAPGVDLDRDVLGQMDFAPLVEDPRLMDARIFAPGPMGLGAELILLNLDRRITLDATGRTLFINFEKMRVRTLADIAEIEAHVARVCAPLGHRVDVIVNYDGTRIEEELEAPYAAMVARLETAYYHRVSRYARSGFLRMKLGRSLRAVFATAGEARAHLGADPGDLTNAPGGDTSGTQ